MEGVPASLTFDGRRIPPSSPPSGCAPPSSPPSLQSPSIGGTTHAPRPRHPPPPPADPAPDLDPKFEFESSLEAIVLLQRSMLEKQWELPFKDDISSKEDKVDERLSKATVVVARSGVSARQRRMSSRRRGAGRKSVTISP